MTPTTPNPSITPTTPATSRTVMPRCPVMARPGPRPIAARAAIAATLAYQALSVAVVVGQSTVEPSVPATQRIRARW